MIDVLRSRAVDYLATHKRAIVGTAGTGGASAMPVAYHASGLQVECLLPRWADALFHIEADPRLVLIVLGDGGVWLQYCGRAQVLNDPDWSAWLDGHSPLADPSGLYQVIRISPVRIDLFDDDRGWGARETLDL